MNLIFGIVKLLIVIVMITCAIIGIFNAGQATGEDNIRKYCVQNGVADYKTDDNGFVTWVLKVNQK